jgi:hypothetical protein
MLRRSKRRAGMWWRGVLRSTVWLNRLRTLRVRTSHSFLLDVARARTVSGRGGHFRVRAETSLIRNRWTTTPNRVNRDPAYGPARSGVTVRFEARQNQMSRLPGFSPRLELLEAATTNHLTKTIARWADFVDRMTYAGQII